LSDTPIPASSPPAAGDPSSPDKVKDMEDQVVSRLHLTEEKVASRHKFEEKERMEARKKAQQEKMQAKRVCLSNLLPCLFKISIFR
jgi:hypothetical protein